MEALLKKSTQKFGWVIGNYHSCLLVWFREIWIFHDCTGRTIHWKLDAENLHEGVSLQEVLHEWRTNERLDELEMSCSSKRIWTGYFIKKKSFLRLISTFVGNIDSEEDLEYVAESWKHARPDHYQMIKWVCNFYPLKVKKKKYRTKLEKLPTSCIRYKGEIVAHEWIDHHGEIRNQFTHPDHRQKGLGTIAELDLMQKSIRYLRIIILVQFDLQSRSSAFQICRADAWHYLYANWEMPILDDRKGRLRNCWLVYKDEV